MNDTALQKQNGSFDPGGVTLASFPVSPTRPGNEARVTSAAASLQNNVLTE